MKLSGTLHECIGCGHKFYHITVTPPKRRMDIDCPFCACSVTTEKNVEIEIKEPRYRLVMSAANHQFRYSERTWETREEATKVAKVEQDLWGYDCEVEEVWE